MASIGTAYASVASSGPANTISSLTDILQETNRKVESAMAKIDEHVDQLEEDIDYFNRKLEQQDEKNQGYEKSIDENFIINIEQDKKIKALEDTVQFLKDYTNYLEGRIMSLEDKLNDKKVC